MTAHPAPPTPPGHGPAQVRRIETLDDPRLEPYRNLKDRELARAGGRFLVEGILNVRRLLESGWPVESVLAAEPRAAELASLVPPGVPLYTLPAREISRIVGFGFHGGALACGRRRPPAPLERLVEPRDAPATVVVLPKITNTENLGGLIRIAAAFGAAGVLLGPECCDAFYRQAVRVSMGTVFKLPIARSTDLHADLADLRQTWGLQLIAAVLEPDAEPLPSAAPARRMALLLGNETTGLDECTVALCDRRVTIPMRLGTDSLNVAVAAAVLLYHFTVACPPAR